MLKNKNPKINFHRVQNGRLWIEPMSFAFHCWLVCQVISYILGKTVSLLLALTSPSVHPHEVLINISCGQRTSPSVKFALNSLWYLAEGLPFIPMWKLNCLYGIRVQDDISASDGTELSSSFPTDCLARVRNWFLIGVIRQCGSAAMVKHNLGVMFISISW